MKTRCFFFLFLLLPAVASAGITQLYDTQTLDYWGSRYRISTQKILDTVIWQALLETEKRRLGGKPELQFPHFADGRAREYPLAFYTPYQGRRVILPVLSLKFLDDLCTAYAWLQINGYDLQTISEYTAVLRYARTRKNDFPSPLPTLGIPADALADPEVNALALRHFVTARIFILLHEMGHILYRHSADSSDASQANEQQADRFAIRVMQRTGLEPFGMLVFFVADAHWSSGPDKVVRTHPLSGARIKALAASIENPAIAKQMSRFGQLLDDPDIRAGFKAIGNSADLTMLAPRRPQEPDYFPLHDKIKVAHQLFSGAFIGTFTQGASVEPVSAQMVLTREGNQVHGYYNFGLGLGEITGSVQDDTLYYQWQWANNYGNGVLTMRPDGSFSGTWGYREADAGAGYWRGARKK